MKKLNVLQLIKQKLSKKYVEIELGFESSNSKYRKNYLNKIIDNDNIWNYGIKKT